MNIGQWKRATVVGLTLTTAGAPDKDDNVVTTPVVSVRTDNSGIVHYITYEFFIGAGIAIKVGTEFLLSHTSDGYIDIRPMIRLDIPMWKDDEDK